MFWDRAHSFCVTFLSVGRAWGAESSGAETLILTPVPPTFLKYSRVFVKGEMELPVWGMLDYAVGGDEDKGKTGALEVEWRRVPRRRVRRNPMRKAQI